MKIMGDTVFVDAYDDDDIARALLENDTDEILAETNPPFCPQYPLRSACSSTVNQAVS